MAGHPHDRHELEMVARLREALGDRLESVVIYGPAAHEDDYPARLGEHMLIVVGDLALDTLRLLATPVQWWLKRDHPWPRLFTPGLLRGSADVFPIEMVDLRNHRRVVHGSDPIAGIEIDRELLRLQCERELREKLMRLREGYVECAGRSGGRAMLRDLIAASYPSFARVFRGGLYLLDVPIPRRDAEVIAALCEHLDLPSTAFTRIAPIVHGDRHDDLTAAFSAYYDALAIIEHRVDRLIVRRERRTP